MSLNLEQREWTNLRIELTLNSSLLKLIEFSFVSLNFFNDIEVQFENKNTLKLVFNFVEYENRHWNRYNEVILLAILVQKNSLKKLKVLLWNETNFFHEYIKFT